ncbi:hypothetical protein SRABI106_02391 [Rahnella aquatilis]|nr:hypothetical protein SRABI106_02391 [Rahnella aquatilis]
MATIGADTADVAENAAPCPAACKTGTFSTEAATAEKCGINHGEATPKTTHNSASNTLLSVISRGAGVASAAAGLRGVPKKVTPKTLAIHISASAPVRARPTASSGPSRRAINT